MKPDAPVNTHSAVYQAILDEENERKSTPGNNYTSENQLLENLRHSSSISPTQSSTLRRLQNVLDITGEGKCRCTPMCFGVVTLHFDLTLLTTASLLTRVQVPKNECN